MKPAIRHILLLCAAILLSGAGTRATEPAPETEITRSVESGNTPGLETRHAIPGDEAARFGRLLVQTPQGRVEPLNTYASELLRKLHHRDRYGRLNADEFLLGLLCDPQHWSHEPLIYLPDRGVRQLLFETDTAIGPKPSTKTPLGTDTEARPTKSKYVSFTDFFTPDGSYRLAGAVERAYAKAPGARTKQDKELLKTDEKVNIFYSLLSGKLLALFPAYGHPAANAPTVHNTPDTSATTALRWYSLGDDLSGLPQQDSLFITQALGSYLQAVTEGHNEEDTDKSGDLLGRIATYQQAYARDLGISPGRIRAELFYNRTDIFRTSFRGYLILGFLLLASLFATSGPKRPKDTKRPQASQNPKDTKDPQNLKDTKRLLPAALGLLIAATFLWQTAGLGLRWYISERAPWTNAYESMVYVGWTTVLAGLLFARRSRLTLALATLMGGVILFVANLNWLDPQITPLVPVLRSYWLMIHVSVITASYGFFGICTITGVASLVAIIAGRPTRELRIVGELSMLIGQVLLAAGIFLGAVWANESWGRYWGWDPKETWALVTLLVYTLITHARHIPKLNNDFIFAALSVVAIYSVLMTFFGVNYYLSGLHSYGGSGEIPALPVVCATLGVGLLILLAGLRRRKG